MANEALQNFIADDDEMIDFSSSENKPAAPAAELQTEPAGDKNLRKAYEDYSKIRDYKTNTASYEGNSFELVNPESNRNVNADIDYQNREKEYFDRLTKEYADPVIAQAVQRIEQRTGKKITYNDFDKLCRSYAAELTQLDARTKNREPNPVDYRNYYDQLIQNRKVVPAYMNNARTVEKNMVDEIYSLMERHRVNDNRTIHVDVGRSVNIRHKGKVSIRDDNHNREITINNGDDVKLLHMQYRKDFLDKKFKKEIVGESANDSDGGHSSEGFE